MPRDPARIPLLLGALHRRWDASPDELGAVLAQVLGEPMPWHPLAHMGDERLVALLAFHAAPREDLREIVVAVAGAESLEDRRALVLDAVRHAWQLDPDLRLGQLLHHAVRAANPDLGPHPLLALEDGVLLERLGPETEAERAYVRDEPRRRQEAWRAFERRMPGILRALGDERRQRGAGD